MSTTNTIQETDARLLANRLGRWVWDGLENHGAILNTELTILPNQAGWRIRRFLEEMGDDWRDEA